MIIFLSGPVSGIPDYNRAAFASVAAEFRASGHTVINPLEQTQSIAERIKCPALLWCLSMALLWPMLEKADAVVMLPGWERSAGARREHRRAFELGKCVSVLTRLP